MCSRGSSRGAKGRPRPQRSFVALASLELSNEAPRRCIGVASKSRSGSLPSGTRHSARGNPIVDRATPPIGVRTTFAIAPPTSPVRSTAFGDVETRIGAFCGITCGRTRASIAARRTSSHCNSTIVIVQPNVWKSRFWCFDNRGRSLWQKLRSAMCVARTVTVDEPPLSLDGTAPTQSLRLVAPMCSWTTVLAAADARVAG